jgi:hypothetical protein
MAENPSKVSQPAYIEWRFLCDFDREKFKVMQLDAFFKKGALIGLF